MDGIIKKLDKSSAPQPAADGMEPFWSDCKRRVDDGAVTPIVSNRITTAMLNAEPGQLARAWAEDISSDLSEKDNSDLARVAQFYRIRLKNVVGAKRQYLESLKSYLVAAACDDPKVDAVLAKEFMDEERRQAVHFSDLARELGYPCYRDATCNSLRLLAELPLPIYLTTCHHQFLEHALEQTGSKQPVSEIFFWHDGLRRISSIFAREPNYVPSVQRPLVYHLFGRDDHEESLVLTEDDYLDYLVKLSSLSHEATLTENKLDIPYSVSLALTSTALIVLGYDVYGWDFRVLFRGLLQTTCESRKELTPKSIFVQVEPDTGDDTTKRLEIEGYLSKYFEESHFSVYFGDMQSCVYELWQHWKGS